MKNIRIGGLIFLFLSSMGFLHSAEKDCKEKKCGCEKTQEAKVCPPKPCPAKPKKECPPKPKKVCPPKPKKVCPPKPKKECPSKSCSPKRDPQPCS